MMLKIIRSLISFAFLFVGAATVHASIELKKGDRIALVGAGMG